MWACIETKVNYKKHEYTYVKAHDNSPAGSDSAQQGRLLPTTRTTGTLVLYHTAEYRGEDNKEWNFWNEPTNTVPLIHVL